MSPNEKLQAAVSISVSQNLCFKCATKEQLMGRQVAELSGKFTGSADAVSLSGVLVDSFCCQMVSQLFSLEEFVVLQPLTHTKKKMLHARTRD